MEPITITGAKLEEGKLILTVDRACLGMAMGWIRKKKDMAYDLELKEHREKRSLNANAYAWSLINEIGKALRIKSIDVYREAVLNVGASYTPICIQEDKVEAVRRQWESNGLGWQMIDQGPSRVDGCRVVFAYPGSSTYDNAQMARLIDGLVQDCKALGIETRSPEEIASMLGEWDAE